MSKSTVAIVALSATLLISNAWWAFQLFDAGITQTYMGVSAEENKQALAQSFSAISAASKNDATHETIIATVNKVGDNSKPFEEDGYVWVGQIGLKFDEQGKLIAAANSGEIP